LRGDDACLNQVTELVERLGRDFCHLRYRGDAELRGEVLVRLAGHRYQRTARLKETECLLDGLAPDGIEDRIEIFREGLQIRGLVVDDVVGTEPGGCCDAVAGGRRNNVHATVL